MHRRPTIPPNGGSPRPRVSTDPPRSSESVPEPPTEIFSAGEPTEMIDTSQSCCTTGDSATEDAPKPPRTRRSWGWVIAVVLVIAALVALAVLGTVLLTRGSANAASQEEQVRSTIENFDAAIQKGDLATLRGHHLRDDPGRPTSTTTTTHGPTRTSGSRPPSSIRWSPASTRSSSSTSTPRPTSRRSWPTPRRPGRRAASICSSATISGRSARTADPQNDFGAVPYVERTKPRRIRAGCQLAETDRPALCRSLHASMTRSVMPASAFFR